MTVTEYLESLGITKLQSRYLKRNCEILDKYGDNIQVLAACRTFYASVFTFVRARRVCAFTIQTPFYDSYWHGQPSASGLDALKNGQSTVEISRLKVGTPQKVENMLAHIKEVIDSEHGQGFVADDIDKKMNPEVRKVSKKTFLGEVRVRSWIKNYGYNHRNSGRLPAQKVDGDPMPFGLNDKEVRAGNKYYGYFLCKNGNIISYERGGYYSSASDSESKDGSDYSQGPGNMVHPTEALRRYQLGQDPVMRAEQPTTYNETVFQHQTLFDMEPDHMEQFEAQVLCRNLDDSTQGKPGSYYAGHRIDDPLKDTWIPKQS